jgi:5-methylcytosine-specific restriction endonuclease McrA
LVLGTFQQGGWFVLDLNHDGSGSSVSGDDGVCAKPSSGSKITARGLLRLLEQQQHRCALTGRPLTPELATLDHIMPLSKGGLNTMENAQIVHKDANQAKGTMTLHEFVGMCREVVRFHDGESSE